jgi:hypothetical protein
MSCCTETVQTNSPSLVRYNIEDESDYSSYSIRLWLRELLQMENALKSFSHRYFRYEKLWGIRARYIDEK